MLRFSDVPCHRGFPYAGALWLVAVAGILAVVGTSLTPYAVERMSDRGFRRSVQAIIVAISVVYIARAVALVRLRAATDSPKRCAPSTARP